MTTTLSLAEWKAAEKRSKWAGFPNIVNQGYDPSVGHRVFDWTEYKTDERGRRHFYDEKGREVKIIPCEAEGYWKGFSHTIDLLVDKTWFHECLGDTFEIVAPHWLHEGETETYRFKRVRLANRTCEKTGQDLFAWACWERGYLYFPNLETIRRPKKG